MVEEWQRHLEWFFWGKQIYPNLEGCPLFSVFFLLDVDVFEVATKKNVAIRGRTDSCHQQRI